jgi:hypothetical protein
MKKKPNISAIYIIYNYFWSPESFTFVAFGRNVAVYQHRKVDRDKKISKWEEQPKRKEKNVNEKESNLLKDSRKAENKDN